MPNKKQEEEIARALLDWYNANHGARFEICGWPDESRSVWDLEAVCCLSGEKMLIEVGEREVGDFQARVALSREWQTEFNRVASGHGNLPPGQWYLDFARPPIRDVKTAQRQRFINSVLDEVAPHLRPGQREPVGVLLTHTSEGSPALEGLTARVALRNPAPGFSIRVYWQLGGWYDWAKELLKVTKGTILDEVNRKFASAPPGGKRVLLLWSWSLADPLEDQICETGQTFHDTAAYHRLDAAYLVEWTAGRRVLELFERRERA